MSGALVDLSKEGNLRIGGNDAYASLGYSGTLSIDLCHGLDLAIQGSATGEAGVSRQILDFLRATVEIEAGVEAGLRLTARISPTVLDEIGLVASVQAYLKAYVQANLEVSLTLEKIIQGVRRETDHATYLIFRDFAERLEVGVGVQANAQVAVTAAAELVCQGRLTADRSRGEEPGFDLRMNAEAGFMFGAGVDFFAMARLNDLSGFFRNTKQVLLDEIRAEAEAKTAIGERQLDIIFHAWSTAIDLIIDGSLGQDESPLESLASNGRRFMTQFVMDEFLAAYGRLLDTVFDEAVEAIEQHAGLRAEDLDRLLLALHDLESRLPAVQAFHDLLPILDNVQAIYQSIGLPGHDLVQEAITHLYMLGYLLDDANREHYRMLPAFARARYQGATGQSLSELNAPTQALLYLENGCFSDWLRDFSGLNNTPVGEFLDLLASRNISVAGIVHMLVDDDPDDGRQLIMLALDLLEAFFNQEVTPAIENLIKPVLDDTELGANYYDCVLESTIRSFPTLFTTLLRGYVGNPDDKDSTARLRYICNRYLLTLFSKNVSFFCGQLLTFSADNISNSVAVASQNIRYGRFRHMARGMFYSLEDRIEHFLPYPMRVEIEQDFMDDLIEATEDFLLEIFAIADRAMGRGAWTSERINKLTGAIEGMLLNPDDGALDFASLDAAALESLIDQIADCDFLPAGSTESLQDLAEVMSAIGLQQFKEFLFNMPVEAAIYFVRLLKILLVNLIEEILEFIEDFLDGIKEGLEDALAALEQIIEDLTNAVEQLLANIEDLLDSLYDEVEDALNAFFDSLLDELDFGDLGWLEELLDWVIDLFGGDSSEDKARNALNALRQQALNNLNQGRVRTNLRARVLSTEPYGDQDFSEWLNTHVLTQSLRDELGKVKFKTSGAMFTKRGDAFRSVVTSNLNLASVAFERRSKSLQLVRHGSEQRAKQTRLNALRRRDNAINDLRLSEIRINSPLMVDAARDDLPIYGEHVLLEIDFDQVDIRDVIKRQFPVRTEDLQDPASGRLYTSLVKMAVRSSTADLDATSPLNLKILVNGEEIPLERVELDGRHVLRLHLGRPLIRKGQNDLYVVLAAPPGRAESFVAHRQFTCDDDSRRRRSNTVYIDPEKTVIDTKGDDHLDARKVELDDREMVVITNAGDRPVNLEGWRLSDAAGHEYVFHNASIKPGTSYHLIVGETPGGNGWIGTYYGRVIALLNNRGEFLKLTDATGKVVSQLYTGNPDSNKHIHIYRGAAQ